MKGKLKKAHADAVAEAQAKRKAFNDLRDAAKKEDVDLSQDSDAFNRLDEAAKEMSAADEKAANIADMLLKASDWDEGAPNVGAQIGEAYDGDPRGADRPKGVSESAHRVLQSEGYKTLKQSGLLNSTAKIGSHDLGKAFERHELKTLIVGDSNTSAGAFVVEDRGPYVPLLDRPISVTQLVAQAMTDSDAIEWVSQTSQPSAAAPVAEADDLATGTKPESAMAFQLNTTNVVNIAHWIPVTRRALADAGQLQGIIDNEMTQGLAQELEDQIYAGDGVGENFSGLVTDAGNTYAKQVADTVADAIHQAMTLVRLDFCEPSAVVMHPNDWQRLRLEKDLDGQYQYGPPALSGDRQIWGLPIVPSTVATEGEALIGDFSRAATLWMREGMTLRATDSHDDLFIKNIVVVLAEMRAAFAVVRPDCLATATALNT